MTPTPYAILEARETLLIEAFLACEDCDQGDELLDEIEVVEGLMREARNC